MDAPETKSKQRHWTVRVLLSKTFLIPVAIVVAYTLTGFFLAPYLIQRYATRFADEKLRCSLAIEEVRLNPYALTLEIKNFDLKELSGSPLIAFQDLFINFQVSSLWRWAFTFADVRIEEPSIHIQVMEDGRVNLIDVMDRIPKGENKTETDSAEKGEKDEAPLPLTIEHIVFSQGRLLFTDLSDATDASVTLEPLHLEVKNFTSLPDKKGIHSFEATLPHGAKLRWAGEMSTSPLWSEGDIEVTDFNVATVWEFLQDEIRLEKPKGRVNFSAKYHFTHANASHTLLIDGIKVHTSGLSLTSPGVKGPIFTMDSIRLDKGRFDLSSREFSVGQLALSQGSVAATVNEQGRLNFQELIAVDAKAKSVAVKTEGSEQPPWQINFKSVSLDALSVKYIDRSRAYPTEIGTASLGMKLKARLSYGPEKTQAIVEDADIAFSDVSLKEIAQGDPLIHLEKLSVQGTRVDLDARLLDVESVAVEGGDARVLKEKEGTLNLARVLGGVGKGKIQKEVTAIAEEAREEMKPWAIAVGSAEMTGFGVAFTDQSFSPAQSLDVDNLTLKVSNIKSDFKAPLPFEASLTLRQGGSVTAKGRFGLAEKSAEASVQVSNLTLIPVQPYLAQVAFLTLDSGTLSLGGKVNRTQGKNGPSTKFSGDVTVHNLLVSESATDQRFLSWKEMKMNGITLSLGPDKLEVGEVRLREPFGKLIIYEDQSVSLKKVLRPSNEKAEEIAPASKEQPPGSFPVNVKKIQIYKGGLDFADLSLTPQFAAKIRELKGAIVGLSTKEGERTQVELNGRVDAYGTSKIRGQLEPFNVKRFTDISMIFRNVEMTNLTPYSAKFAGYRIASGKLSLDLRYRINNSELKGENQIILDKLTLGEKVDNPDAPELPLDLALALLRDSDDRIDIGLPVSGNLDDPQFTYSHLIWKALLNLFKKIITAPFRALSSLLGVEDEKLDVIEFDTGKTVLSPPEEEKVENLSEALARRPQLTLKIQGGYDPVGDGAALKSFAIRHEIAKKIGKAIAPDEAPEPVDVNDPLIQKAIEDLVRERISPQVLEAARKEAFKRAAEAVKKEEKGVPLFLPADLTRELYTSLLQKVIDAHPVTEAELKHLGQARAKAVKDALVATKKVGEERLIAIEPAAAEKEGEQTVESRLTLDVTR